MTSRGDAGAPEHQVAFGRALLSARVAARMTQAEVARGAEMDRSFYVGVETGKRNVSLDKIVRLARALKVRPASLLENVGNTH